MKMDEVRSRPATIVFSSRADARYIATLLNFWRERGEFPRSISELARLSLEGFVDLLVTNNITTFVSTHEAADELITRSGLRTRNTLNGRNKIEALSGEGLKLDSLTGTDPAAGHKRSIKTNPVPKDSPDFNTALAAFEQGMEEDIKTRVKKAQENTDTFRNALLPKGEG